MSAPGSSALASVVGRYAIGEEIARGGLATVHLGLVLGEAGFSRTVAVKRLLPAFARDPDFVASFLDEAKLASRVRHPNVVPTLDVLAQDGELFIVMEYVLGESLAGLIRAAADRDEAIPLAVVSAVLCDALQGLHAAHEAKDERGAKLHVIHRDVSPQNVIVGVDGVARVLDFGIAKAAGRAQITREGQVKGKLGYLAPEQLRQRAERASDVYAAGVCLWEALTRRRLFEGDNESAVLARILAGLVARPSKHAAEVPPELDEVVLRALRRAPGERFATAREMALALAAAAAPASTAEVGAWVELMAAVGLARRAESLAAIEAGGPPPGSAPVGIDDEPTVALRIAPDDTASAPVSSAPVTTPHPVGPAPIEPKERRSSLVRGGLSVALAAVALLVGLVWGARGKAPSESPTPPIAAALPLPVARVEMPSPSPPSNAEAAPPVVVSPTAAAPSATPSVVVARARPALAVSPKASCDPPYSVDAEGIRHYKKGCLR